jgi:DNA-binding response OmpR family regulator
MSSPRKGRVLVVDDDPVILELVRGWLEEAGYAVEVRDSALGTAQQVLVDQPDVVLLDVMMPALSGSELAQLIRRHHRTSLASVIFHSSLEPEALQALVVKTGALGALPKTNDAESFVAAFERLMSHRAAPTGQTRRVGDVP